MNKELKAIIELVEKDIGNKLSLPEKITAIIGYKYGVMEGLNRSEQLLKRATKDVLK